MRLSDDRGRRDIATVLTVYETEDNGNEDQRGHGCERQSADDRATERCVLLAALPQAQRHRRHADDHGERGHQDRTKAYEARLEGSSDRVAELLEALAREADDEHAVGGRNAH